MERFDKIQPCHHLAFSSRASSRGQARGYANEVPASQPADTLTEGGEAVGKGSPLKIV